MKLQKVSYHVKYKVFLVGIAHKAYHHIIENEVIPTIYNSKGNILGILDSKNYVRAVYNSAQKRVIISMEIGASRRINKEEISQLRAGRELELQNLTKVPGVYYLPQLV